MRQSNEFLGEKKKVDSLKVFILKSSDPNKSVFICYFLITFQNRQIRVIGLLRNRSKHTANYA